MGDSRPGQTPSLTQEGTTLIEGNSIELFSNGEFELHVIPEGDSFRVSAPGVARGLAYRDAASMLRSLPGSCQGYTNSRTPGGDQRIYYLTESGLYRAVGQRQTKRIKNAAERAFVERFQSWVFDEVLPSLRKHGHYTIIPTQRPGADGFYEPETLTWDETAALIRQRYGIPLSANQLTRTLRTAGVLKQNGGPRKPYENLFWFTGSSWNVHPHVVPQLVQKVADTTRELQEFRFIQARLQLEGVGSAIDQ